MNKGERDTKKTECRWCTHFKLTRDGWPCPYCDLLKSKGETKDVSSISSYIIENGGIWHMCPLENQEHDAS